MPIGLGSMLFFRLWNLCLQNYWKSLESLKRLRVPARRRINYPPEEGRSASFVLWASDTAHDCLLHFGRRSPNNRRPGPLGSTPVLPGSAWRWWREDRQLTARSLATDAPAPGRHGDSQREERRYYRNRSEDRGEAAAAPESE